MSPFMPTVTASLSVFVLCSCAAPCAGVLPGALDYYVSAPLMRKRSKAISKVTGPGGVGEGGNVGRGGAGGLSVAQ
jgi:hypothetical protein